MEHLIWIKIIFLGSICSLHAESRNFDPNRLTLEYLPFEDQQQRVPFQQFWNSINPHSSIGPSSENFQNSNIFRQPYSTQEYSSPSRQQLQNFGQPNYQSGADTFPSIWNTAQLISSQPSTGQGQSFSGQRSPSLLRFQRYPAQNNQNFVGLPSQDYNNQMHSVPNYQGMDPSIYGNSGNFGRAQPASTLQTNSQSPEKKPFQLFWDCVNPKTPLGSASKNPKKSDPLSSGIGFDTSNQSQQSYPSQQPYQSPQPYTSQQPFNTLSQLNRPNSGYGFLNF